MRSRIKAPLVRRLQTFSSVKAMESHANSVAAAESESDAPSARRLVIRVVMPKGSLQAPERRRLSRGALLLILAAAAGLLSWVGVSMFSTDPPPAPAVTQRTQTSESLSPSPVPARSEAAPDEPLPESASETAATTSTEAKPVEPEVRAQADAPSSAINEVLPPVPQSALDTIRGTVRVTVRVIVDKQGAVLAAATDDAGPSRYFERLALEASKKWTFTPDDSAEPRVMLVRFNFTNAGTTARANPLQ
jgi:TonB family protein